MLKRLAIAFLAVFCLAGDASAACGSRGEGRFPRARAALRSVLPASPVFPRLRASVAPQAKLVALSGGCNPVFGCPAPTAPAPMLKVPMKK